MYMPTQELSAQTVQLIESHSATVAERSSRMHKNDVQLTVSLSTDAYTGLYTGFILVYSGIRVIEMHYCAAVLIGCITDFTRPSVCLFLMQNKSSRYARVDRDQCFSTYDYISTCEDRNNLNRQIHYNAGVCMTTSNFENRN